MNNTVLISTERCGSSQATTDDHEESSRNGQEGEGEVTAPSVQASKLEDFQGQLHSLDLYLLKYFTGMCIMAKKGRGLLKSNSDGDVGMKTNNCYTRKKVVIFRPKPETQKV